jgi:hypothetical protein
VLELQGAQHDVVLHVADQVHAMAIGDVRDPLTRKIWRVRVPQRLAVIGQDDDQRVVQSSALLQAGQQFGNLLVRHGQAFDMPRAKAAGAGIAPGGMARGVGKWPDRK